MARERPRRLRPEQAPRVELDVADLDHEGRGVGRVDGKVVFVDGALPGERVRARYTRTGRRFDEACVERVLAPAPARVEPFCPLFGRCGGCVLQHLDPAAQVRAHEARVAAARARAAGAPPDHWRPPLPGPARGYRARARLAARHVAGRGMLLGFRERDGRYIADTEQCGILDPRLERLLPPLRRALGAARAARVQAVEGEPALVARAAANARANGLAAGGLPHGRPGGHRGRRRARPARARRGPARSAAGRRPRPGRRAGGGAPRARRLRLLRPGHALP
ncbi:MAG: TRAM domain-containing protein [Halofilum sp. (in: g-proteobacteria)]|nr:TRAM domain-containing protein [Halofilum sp. (in: g-proteobacteria)]